MKGRKERRNKRMKEERGCGDLRMEEKRERGKERGKGRREGRKEEANESDIGR